MSHNGLNDGESFEYPRKRWHVTFTGHVEMETQTAMGAVSMVATQLAARLPVGIEITQMSVHEPFPALAEPFNVAPKEPEPA